MPEIKVKSAFSIETKVYLVLTEDEARALKSICIYGPDEFVKWFYAHQGKFYLQPHENSLRSLFQTVRNELPKQLRKIDKIKEYVVSQLKNGQ